VENENAKYSLYSTVHGAGRNEVAGIYDHETGECKREGKVTQAMMRSWIDRSGIELRGGGPDEASGCYKRLDEVLASVSDSVRILHRFTPVGVAF